MIILSLISWKMILVMVFMDLSSDECLQRHISQFGIINQLRKSSLNSFTVGLIKAKVYWIMVRIGLFTAPVFQGNTLWYPIMIFTVWFPPFCCIISFLTFPCRTYEVSDDKIWLTGGTKPATLDTGAVVNVPLFVNVGDEILVDSRTGQYMSRA